MVTLPLSLVYSYMAQILMFFMAILVFVYNRRSFANRFFSLFLISLTAWACSGAFAMFLPVTVHHWVAIQMAAGTCAGLCFFYFGSYLGNEGWKPRWTHHLMGIPAVYMIILALLRIFHPEVSGDFAGTVTIVDTKMHRDFDFQYLVYTFGTFVPALTGLARCALTWRRTQGQTRKLVRTIVISMSILVLMLLGFNTLGTILGHGLDATWSMLAIVISTGFISLTLMRDKAWRIEHLLDQVQRMQALVIEQETAAAKGEAVESARRSAELEEALKARDRLLSILTHDFRGGIGEIAESLAELSFHAGGKEAQRLYELSADAHRLRTGFESLLAWAKGSLQGIKPRMKRTGLERVFRAALAPLEGRLGEASFKVDEDFGRLEPWADPDMVQIIFSNLLSNALKHLGKGKTLRFRAEEEEGLPGGAGRRRIKVLYSDDGPGFPAEIAKQDGLGGGMGLLLCKDFMERMGGSFAIHPGPGGGIELSFPGEPR